MFADYIDNMFAKFHNELLIPFNTLTKRGKNA